MSVEYLPGSKIPNPLSGLPSSHCETLVRISKLMGAIRGLEGGC